MTIPIIANVLVGALVIANQAMAAEPSILLAAMGGLNLGVALALSVVIAVERI